MLVLKNAVFALAHILDILLTIYLWIIVARALISWVEPNPYNPVVRFLYRVTEPVLGPIRRRMPFFRGVGIDLSPLVVFFVIYFLQLVVVASIKQYAMGLY